MSPLFAAMLCAARTFALITVLTLVSSLTGQPQKPVPPDSKSVISYLNQSISWHQHFSVEEQLATEPGDVLFVNQNRQLADEIIRLSFDFAKAEAQTIAPESDAQRTDQNGVPGQALNHLQTMAAKADLLVNEEQSTLDSLNAQLAQARGKRRNSLRDAVAKAESELQIARTRRDALHTMLDYTNSATGKATEGNTLRSQIDELERTVPGLSVTKKPTDNSSEPRTVAPSTAPAGSTTGAASTTAAERQKEVTGIIVLVSQLMRLSRKSKSLGEAIQLTSSLAESSKSLRAPLVGALKQASQRGDEISSESDTTDSAVLKQQKAELDTIVAQFKQNSAALLPLSKQRVLLDVYEHNLTDWKQAVREQYKSNLRELALRAAALAAVLIVLFAFSELSRRAIFRYVHDTRRRYQFLLLKRILLWVLVVIVLSVTFANQLGSLATFAGLLTAGVAVALQNVILSIVGYFLLIGKYGVRVGDRVQIAGVTGEVVEIGLVRLHLMEYGSGDWYAQPTGRVVAFSNSVVFQPTSGMFKQIPGTNYVWHEITVTLAAVSDFRAVEKRLLSAVGSVYSRYRENIERQSKQAVKTIGRSSGGFLTPQSRLRFTTAGLEVVIRYPLEFENASEIDDRITREILDAIEQPPQLKLVGIGAPSAA